MHTHTHTHTKHTICPGDVLVLATVMNMLNIPCKNCFTVNTLWDVRPTLSGGCTVSIRLKVRAHLRRVFLQRPIAIRQTSLAGVYCQ